jgi:antitoxin Phd
MSTLTFRNRMGELVDIQPVTATLLKNQFARVLDQALRRGPVAITKHDAAKAILISMEDFEALVGERSQSLDALDARFDGLLMRMQTPSAKKGMDAAFNATPRALGKAAVKAAARSTRK